MPGRSSAWSRSRRSGRAVACNVAAWRTHSPTERCSTQAFPSPPLDGRSRRRAARGSLTSIATAACGSTRWLGSSRTWRSRTSRRPVGGCRSTSGSCGGSGSTWSSRFSRTTRSTLVTWSSGQAAIAAGRRWSLRGDRGGRAEVDSVWIHLDRDQRPARIEGFAIYGEAAGDRRVSTKLELPDPPEDGSRPSRGRCV